MAKAIETNRGGGSFNNHGKVASPQGPCSHEIPASGRATTGGEDGGEPKGKVGAHQQTPGSIITVKSYDGLQPGPGTMPAGENRLSTPMDRNANGTSIGAHGEASGTGPSGGGKISSPWGSGPFGDSAG